MVKNTTFYHVFIMMKSYQILKGMSCDIFYFLIVIKSHRKTIFYNYCVFIQSLICVLSLQRTGTVVCIDALPPIPVVQYLLTHQMCIHSKTKSP